MWPLTRCHTTSWQTCSSDDAARHTQCGSCSVRAAAHAFECFLLGSSSIMRCSRCAFQLPLLQTVRPTL